MREIKFRGYRNFAGNALYLPDKRWIYGYYYFQEGKHYIKNIDDWKSSYVVEPDSVGEYINLHDKDGKEIYEGDIIRDCNGLDVTWEVKWCEKEACFLGLDWCGKPNEVIGNIYENPELVK